MHLRGEVWSAHAGRIQAGRLRLRADGTPARAAEVDLTDGPARAWHAFALCLNVPADARGLTLSLAQSAHAETRLRALELELVDMQPSATPELSPIAIEPLIVLARAFGHLRYFYPAQASDREWHAIATGGVAAVRAAEDPDRLADALATWARTIGPDIAFTRGAELNPPSPDPSGPGWRHHGVAGDNTLYRSEFVAVSRAPDRIVADIGAGLRIDYPRAHPGQSAPTSIPPLVVDPCAALAHPRDHRLATVIEAWSLLEQFYPYHDAMRTDWAHALRTALPAAADASEELALLPVLRRMLAELRDGHVRVTHSAQTTCVLPLEWRWIEDRVVLTELRGATSGLRVGDVVTAIDGVAAPTRVHDAEAQVSAATPAHRRELALRLLRHEPAAPVTELTLQDGRTVAVACVADATPVPSDSPFSELGDGVLAVRLGRLDATSLRTALPRIAAASGLVVDLRPAAALWILLPHLVRAPLDAHGYATWDTFFPGPGGRALGPVQRSTISPRPPRITAPIAFVADERAISAAETALAYVHEHRLAPIFGATTAGTTCDINEKFIAGFSLRWTGCVALRRDGSGFHGTGIPPTHPVAPTLAGVTAGRDEPLEAAAAWVRGELARPAASTLP
ncbi:S41 family peptidase [Nannocystis pusilla]|uniref:S41 family peptidase n=1 Tax=Nannocystis pusilla TaxID=889268 RepID=UPI003DA49B26